jgi:hypothetical protein
MGQALDYLPRPMAGGGDGGGAGKPDRGVSGSQPDPRPLVHLGSDTSYAALAVLIEGSEE